MTFAVANFLIITGLIISITGSAMGIVLAYFN